FTALGAPGGGLHGTGIVSPFGGLTESGVDDLNANGTGYGGGGLGEGTIGLGTIGTMGHGAGAGSGQGYGAGAGRGLSARPVPSGGAGSGMRAFVEAPAPLPAIDPNGRFATTYRPGHGHAAWFDAAVARGEMPEASRELLADLGSQEIAALPAPTDGALAFQT